MKLDQFRRKFYVLERWRHNFKLNIGSISLAFMSLRQNFNPSIIFSTINNFLGRLLSYLMQVSNIRSFFKCITAIFRTLLNYIN